MGRHIEEELPLKASIQKAKNPEVTEKFTWHQQGCVAFKNGCMLTADDRKVSFIIVYIFT